MESFLALFCVVISMAALAFTMLQLGSDERARGIIASVISLLIGAAVVATRGDTFGIAWLHESSRRSDAIAFGVGVPLLAILVGVVTAGRLRTRWAQLTLAVVAFSCILAALIAIVTDRSTWYWEFVALVIGGIALTTVSGTGTFDHSASPNRRIVFGTFTLMGAFTMVGGTLLGLAWASLS